VAGYAFGRLQSALIFGRKFMGELNEINSNNYMFFYELVQLGF